MCAACSYAVDMKTQPVSDMFSRKHIRTKCLPRKCMNILLIQKVLHYCVSVRHCSTIVLLAGWTAYLSISVQISRKTNQIRGDAHMEMQGCSNNSDMHASIHHASIPALVTGAAWWHWWQYWAYAVLRPLPWECNTLNQFWGGQVSSCNCLLHKWLMPPLSKTSEPEQKATHGFSKWCSEKRISNKDSKHISQRKTCISYFLYTLWDCSQIRLRLNRSLEVLLWHSLVMYAGCPSLCQKQWTF